MNSLPVIPLSTWAKGKSDEEVSNFLDYYTRNGFVSMNSHSDSGENDKLAQLFRFID